MRGINRKSSPQVVKGVVQKRNNWKPSENCYRAPRPREVVIERDRPGEGYRHVLTKQDIYDFISLLPDWDNLAVGLNAIVLTAGSSRADGYHVPGVVHVCAWESQLWIAASSKYYEDHSAVFERLGVPCERAVDRLASDENKAAAVWEFRSTFGWYSEDAWVCKFTEDAARGYQLLHILLHELGHHHDRMTTRSQKRTGRGETYAEEYAYKYEGLIWQQYVKTFPLF